MSRASERMAILAARRWLMKRCARIVPDSIEKTETFDWDDSGAKPKRVHIEFWENYGLKINAVAINWRPVNLNLSQLSFYKFYLKLFRADENGHHFLVICGLG